MVTTDSQVEAPPLEARRALVLHEQLLVVDLIELTLNPGSSWCGRRAPRRGGGDPRRLAPAP